MNYRQRTKADDLKDGIMILKSSLREALDLPPTSMRASMLQILAKQNETPQQPNQQNPQSAQPQTTDTSQTQAQGSSFDRDFNQPTHTPAPTAGRQPFQGFGLLSSFREKFTPSPPAPPPTEAQIREEQTRRDAEKIKQNRLEREARAKKLRRVGASVAK